jgi:hypothetical protein
MTRINATGAGEHDSVIDTVFALVLVDSCEGMLQCAGASQKISSVSYSLILQLKWKAF